MKNDPEFNIHFVRLVESYPQLYDYAHTLYADKQETDRVWKTIGQEMGDTGDACMKKWRILRGGYNRFLKNKPKKAYYLAKYMEFLIPYLKSRSKEKVIPNSSDIESNFNEDSQCSDISGIEQDEYIPTKEEPSITIHENTCNGNNMIVKPNKRKTTLPQKRKQTVMDFPVEEEYEDPFKTADLLFLKSLLPEIQMLDFKKKNIFKVIVLNTLNELLLGDGPSPHTSKTEDPS